MNAAQTIKYIVRPGDTLQRIARLFHTTEALILSSNPWVEACYLRPGMVLIIYPEQNYYRGAGYLYTSEGRNTGFTAPHGNQGANLEMNPGFAGSNYESNQSLAMNSDLLPTYTQGSMDFDLETGFPRSISDYNMDPGFGSRGCCR